MSSYLYDKLKEALGGKYVTDSKSNIINDWTPNGLRMLIISRNFIITVNHLGVFGGCTKMVNLDVNLVAQDLDYLSKNNYGKAKLNSLLTKRSFSCLEEIYVDAMFKNYPQVLNLQEYAKEAVSSNARLRFIGYGEFNDFSLRDYINTACKEAYSKKNYGYSLAKDNNRPCKLEYAEVNNPEWYKKYYLRPQFYKKDNPNGDLAIHFKKISEGYNKVTSEAKIEINLSDLKGDFLEIIDRDTNNLGYFDRLGNLFKVLESMKSGKGDAVAVILLPIVAQCLKGTKFGKIAGLTDLVVKKLAEGEMGDSYFQYVRVLYNKYGLYDESESNKLDVGKYLGSKEGFLPVNSILSDLCVAITDKMLKEGYKDVVGMALTINGSNIPEGSFRSKYLKNVSNESNGYEGYFDYIGDIIGKVV